MAPDCTILHLVEKKIQAGGGSDPDPLPFKSIACTLLSLSYTPGYIYILGVKRLDFIIKS